MERTISIYYKAEILAVNSLANIMYKSMLTLRRVKEVLLTIVNEIAIVFEWLFILLLLL